MRKNILVICALGYATSTMIKKNIIDYLENNDFRDWKVEAIGLNMSSGYVKDADIIVSSLELDQSEYEVPVINGVSLISGINAELTFDKIKEAILKHEGGTK